MQQQAARGRFCRLTELTGLCDFVRYGFERSGFLRRKRALLFVFADFIGGFLKFGFDVVARAFLHNAFGGRGSIGRDGG